jgi:hypothetical protein
LTSAHRQTVIGAVALALVILLMASGQLVLCRLAWSGLRFNHGLGSDIAG